MIQNVGLGISQTQRLALSLSMQQSIKLLQMSAPDLDQYLNDMALGNPLLSVKTAANSEFGGNTSTSAAGALTDMVHTQNISIWESLFKQIDALNLSPNLYSISAALIENLNERGYLDCDLGHLVQRTCGQEQIVAKALCIVQSLDPPGVGARNVSECVRLQLERRGIWTELHHQILSALQSGKGNQLEIVYGLNASRPSVVSAIKDIKSARFNPLADFDATVEAPVIPEMFFIVNNENHVSVTLNTDAFPQIELNNSYFLAIKGNSQEIKMYYSQCKRQFDNLFLACERRASTILRIGNYIAKKQALYFIEGASCHKPMRMLDVATELEMHVSTVSRAIAHKYYSNGRNVFTLKSLFSGGVVAGNNKEISKPAICLEIRRFIANETRHSVVSDVRIAKLLELKGVAISRRTVTKYRESMNIPPYKDRELQLLRDFE